MKTYSATSLSLYSSFLLKLHQALTWSKLLLHSSWPAALISLSFPPLESHTICLSPSCMVHDPESATFLFHHFNSPDTLVSSGLTLFPQWLHYYQFHHRLLSWEFPSSLSSILGSFQSFAWNFPIYQLYLVINSSQHLAPRLSFGEFSSSLCRSPLNRIFHPSISWAQPINH